MADGVTFQTAALATPPSATEVATDDAGADGHVQIIKLAISADGSATVIPATAANGLLVDLSRVPAVASATITRVNDSASSVQLVAANAARKALWVFNDSTVALCLKCGTTASLTDFTVKVEAGGFWEMPTTPVFTGRVDGIWVSDAAGAAQVTEL